MASCYVCGKALPKGKGVKKNIYTGASVGGFNMSSNIWLNVLLNSLFGDKRSRARSYYAQRSVCPDCAVGLDAKDRRNVTLLVMTVLTFFALMLVLASSRQ